MPAFGDGDHTDEDSWKCVLFIRHLPKQTPQEIAAMEKLNPHAPDDEPAEPKPAAEAGGGAGAARSQARRRQGVNQIVKDPPT
jgi:hypothetical protein